MKPGELRNGRPLALSAVPVLDTAAFYQWLHHGVLTRGCRVVSYFASADQVGTHLFAVLAHDETGILAVARTQVEGDHFDSMTNEIPQVHLFEREIAEQYGIRPEGHPWLKPVRYHRRYHGAADVWGRNDDEKTLPAVTDFFRVEGEEIHEVAVGPVHAGVIEPGHFRFQCHGEHVFHLEIALGYQHRGIERVLIGGPNKRTMFQMETVAGDTTIGHALAYCQAVEALSGTSVTARAQAIRGIALELERLANHTGDLGALAGDVAYLPTASFCGRLRGDFLNMTAEICGSRFGRGLVRPGSVGFDIQPAQIDTLRARLKTASEQVREAVELLWNTPTVVERFENTGKVTMENAEAIGLVGPAARACGILRDVRHDFPSGIYRFAHLPVMTAHYGDVNSRAFVRWLEIQQSTQFILKQIETLPKTGISTVPKPLAPDSITVSLVEGWRGEICHVALTDSKGQFTRYKITDPSFHNWFGLALALRDGQISDFPLCNKSFNLSYCGHDL